MILRERYLQKLRLLKDQNLIKVITGIRRCGKSTLLEAFRDEVISGGVPAKRIIYISFEERDNLHLTEWISLYDQIIEKVETSDKYYVFLDEVQLINDFETFLVEFPHIDKIIANGKKAYESILLVKDSLHSIQIFQAVSTSRAYPMPFAKKLALWESVLS